MKLDKKLFYEQINRFTNKHSPIFIDMPINSENLSIRLIFSWQSITVNGKFNPIMSAQLVDANKTVGHGKYVVPDLTFNAVEAGTTTTYRLYKYLNSWIERALKNRQGTEEGT